MKIGTNFSQALYKELAEDYSKHDKDTLLVKKEQYEQSLEDSEEILGVLQADLRALKELKEIKFGVGQFVRCEAMFEYEKNPRFWEIQREIALRASDMEVKKKLNDIENEKALIGVYKQLIAKVNSLL